MSEEALSVIRGGFDALARGDVDALVARCHPEIELRPSLVGGPEGTVYHGREGYRAWYADLVEVFESFSFDVEELHADGNRVLAIYTARARARQSGIELTSPGGAVFEVIDGLVTWQLGFQSTEAAWAAFSRSGGG
jgi:ketosteroid isomerase-like protein